MSRRSYTPEEIDQMWRTNATRVFRDSCSTKTTLPKGMPARLKRIQEIDREIEEMTRALREERSALKRENDQSCTHPHKNLEIEEVYRYDDWDRTSTTWYHAKCLVCGKSWHKTEHS